MSSILSHIKAVGKSFDNLESLLEFKLHGLCDVEEQVVKAMPRMIEAASSPALKQALQQHLDQTRLQQQRLEQVFQLMGKEPKRQSSSGIRGLLADGEMICAVDADPAVKDAALICAAQCVEHLEMATYGTCRTFAQQLGLEQVAALLQQSLDEAAAADRALTDVAISGINQTAAKCECEGD
jgi:ferritin-like metal-binding protein YciE